MKKKLIGFFIMSFLILSVLPAVGFTNIRENQEIISYKWFVIIFYKGEVKSISEEKIDYEMYYNFTVIDVSWTRIYYVPPIWYNIERGRIENMSDFFIPKSLFYGILKEDKILGLVLNYGES
jgi:hypothetical protein